MIGSVIGHWALRLSEPIAGYVMVQCLRVLEHSGGRCYGVLRLVLQGHCCLQYGCTVAGSFIEALQLSLWRHCSCQYSGSVPAPIWGHSIGPKTLCW